MTDVATHTLSRIFCLAPQDDLPWLCVVHKLLMQKSQFLVALKRHNITAP